MAETIDGLETNYRLEGRPDGIPVMLSHSLATNLSQWDPQVAALSGRCRILRYDSRGHGGTAASCPGGGRGASQWAF